MLILLLSAGMVTDGNKLVLYGKKKGTQRTAERVKQDLKTFGVEALREVLDGKRAMSALRPDDGASQVCTVGCVFCVQLHSCVWCAVACAARICCLLPGVIGFAALLSCFGTPNDAEDQDLVFQH